MVKVMEDMRVGDKILSSSFIGPFDESNVEIAKMLHMAVSLEQNAELRIEAGKEAHGTQNGNYTRECFVYDPVRGIYLTKYPLIIMNAEEATEQHRRGEEFWISENDVERATAPGLSVRIPDERNIWIPTGNFKDSDILRFAFGRNTEKYGRFLEEVCEIAKFPIWTIDRAWAVGGKGKPFARQVWFYGLLNNCKSGIGGNDRCLHYGNAVRAVPEEDFYQ